MFCWLGVVCGLQFFSIFLVWWFSFWRFSVWKSLVVITAVCFPDVLLGISFCIPFWIHFVSIFDIAFGMRFGKHFDRIPDRNWIQKGSQSGPRIHKKIDFPARLPLQAFMDHFGIILVTFLIPFGHFWGPIVPFWSPFWIVLVPFWSYLLLLQFGIYIFCLL